MTELGRYLFVRFEGWVDQSVADLALAIPATGPQNVLD